MIIRTLVEDTSENKEYKAEHGLSLYIEANDKKILFDSGASGLFFENAEKMGIDISAIDYAIISHGHNDHGGGLEKFFENNSKAEVIIHENAFERHYSKREDKMINIGLDVKLKSNKRLVFIKGRFFIWKGIEVFSDVLPKKALPLSNSNLYSEEQGNIVLDKFTHELNLVISENDKHFLFTGCAHNGIMNIMDYFFEIKGYMPDFVIGGLHLKNRTYTVTKNDKFIIELADYMKKTKSEFYTCHCTGEEAYDVLKDMLKDKIHYLSTGKEIKIY